MFTIETLERLVDKLRKDHSSLLEMNNKTHGCEVKMLNEKTQQLEH